MVYHGIILTDSTDAIDIRPLGAYAIANQLRLCGYNILVIDKFSRIPNEVLFKLLTKHISRYTLFVGYGSSLFASMRMPVSANFLPNGNVTRLVEINRYVKELNPTTKIVFGGSNSAALSRFSLKNNNNIGVDYVVHGYAETMIVDLVQSLEANSKFNFTSTLTGLREVNYDSTAKDFDFKNTKHTWIDSDLVSLGETLPIEIARGCIFRCKFCSYPLLGKDPRDSSYIKDEEVLLSEILENYEKHRTLNYFITDDTFNERTDKIEMMLRVRDRSKLDLSFVSYNRAELISSRPQQISLLKNLNLRGMFLGIESFNLPSAKSIGKGISREDFQEMSSKLKLEFDNKVSITIALIIGLPHDTREIFLENFEWIKKQEPIIDSIIMNELTLASVGAGDSLFFKNPEKYGYTVHNNGQWSSSIWTQEECVQLRAELLNEITKSGRQRVGAFLASYLTSYGYDYNTLIKTPIRDLPDNEITNKKHTFVADYISKLQKL